MLEENVDKKRTDTNRKDKSGRGALLSDMLSSG